MRPLNLDGVTAYYESDNDATFSGEYDDILAGPDDAPVVCKGRVIWYMGEWDER